MHIFEEWNSGLHHRWFQVFDSVELYWKGLDTYELITPVLRITEKNRIPIVQGDTVPEKILVGKGVFKSARNFLVGEYGDAIEDIAFELKEEQRAFFTETGNDYIEPAEFRVIQV